MGINCFPLIPLGFSANTNFFNKESVISLLCAMLRPLLGTCFLVDETGRAMVRCDFSKSPLCHGDDVTFPA